MEDVKIFSKNYEGIMKIYEQLLIEGGIVKVLEE